MDIAGPKIYYFCYEGDHSLGNINLESMSAFKVVLPKEIQGLAEIKYRFLDYMDTSLKIIKATTALFCGGCIIFYWMFNR